MVSSVSRVMPCTVQDHKGIEEGVEEGKEEGIEEGMREQSRS